MGFVSKRVVENISSKGEKLLFKQVKHDLIHDISLLLSFKVKAKITCVMYLITTFHHHVLLKAPFIAGYNCKTKNVASSEKENVQSCLVSSVDTIASSWT